MSMGSNARRLPVWILSLLLVVGVHVGLAMWFLWKPIQKPVELAPAPPMMLALEPLPPPPPPPQAQQVAPDPVEDPVPQLAEAPAPKLVVAKSKPKPKKKPKPRPPEPKKPDEDKKIARKPVESPEKKVSKAEEQVARSEVTDPNSTTTAAASTSSAAASQQGLSSSALRKVKLNWQSELLSHLAHYKVYPEEAKRDEVPGIKINRLRFTLDSEGRVLSYELVTSSGNPLLDRATLEMIRKAQPLPPPPPEILKGRSSIEIVAPLAYELKRI